MHRRDAVLKRQTHGVWTSRGRIFGRESVRIRRFAIRSAILRRLHRQVWYRRERRRSVLRVARKKIDASRSIQSARLSDDDDVLQSLRIRTKSLRVILSKNARRGSVRVRSRLICNRTLSSSSSSSSSLFSLTPTIVTKVIGRAERRRRLRKSNSKRGDGGDTETEEGSVANTTKKTMSSSGTTASTSSAFCGDEEGIEISNDDDVQIVSPSPTIQKTKNTLEDAGDDDNGGPRRGETRRRNTVGRLYTRTSRNSTSRTESRWRRKYTETKTRRYKSCGATDSGRR